MAEIFRPTNGELDVAACLPADFLRSSNLAMNLLRAVKGTFVVDRMSWRPKMDNAVIYLLLNDLRHLLFSDLVAGVAVIRPNGITGRIRLGFTREPATDALQISWTGQPAIVRKRAWPNPIQDLEDSDLAAGVQTLIAYAGILAEFADQGKLKRGGTSRPELRLRLALQRMFPADDFRKVRPSWLEGDKGKPMELDIYSESRNVAVEVQGPYHDRPIFGTDTLERQQARDALKRERCAERGVKLLIANAAALDREIFTLAREEQHARIVELLALAEERGIYEWPEAESDGSEV